ncbi:hypothetical protein Btru_036148 [Bulinus truncatus]|nr:hypothetical protein Btru_036148 [Bulinus truncatus]
MKPISSNTSTTPDAIRPVDQDLGVRTNLLVIISLPRDYLPPQITPPNLALHSPSQAMGVVGRGRGGNNEQPRVKGGEGVEDGNDVTTQSSHQIIGNSSTPFLTSSNEAAESMENTMAGMTYYIHRDSNPVSTLLLTPWSSALTKGSHEDKGTYLESREVMETGNQEMSWKQGIERCHGNRESRDVMETGNQEMSWKQGKK